MATMNPDFIERRHIPDRRATTMMSGTEAMPRSHSMSAVDWIATVLTIIGGINWGLIGLFNFNLVAALFGDFSALSRLIYIVVGLSALYMIYMASKMSK